MDTPLDPTLAEDIKQLLTEVPVPVRAFFASGKVETVAKNLMQKNHLHIDQGAVVEREIILLLLGLKDPAEFTQALAEDANLDQKVINSIVQDVNDQIFVPLREEEMKGGTAVALQPPKPAASITAPSMMPRPSPKAMEGTARPMSVPPAPAAGAGQPASHFHLENKLPMRPSAQVPVAASALNAPVPALPQQPLRPAVASGVGGIKPIPVQPGSVNVLSTESKPPQQIPVPVRPSVSNIAPLPPKMVLPRPAVASGVGGPRPAVAGFRPPVTPFSPKLMGSSKLLEDHEEPHIELDKSKASSSAETPLQQALRTVLPPPPNLPGAMPPPDIMPPSRPAPAAQKVPQTPVKPYSADPYREPIE